MAEKTLEERLSELYEKIDHRDQFFDKDLKTLIDGIRDAREHGGTASVDVTPIVGGYKIVITDSEGVEHVATVKDGGDAYEVYKSTVPEGQSPMTKEEWLETLKGADGADGQDGAPGADAVNPFKGYYPSGVSKPDTGAVGDYLYATPSDSQSTATATIWHYDSTQTPPWTDTGIDVSAVVGVEFGSGQSVSATKIKDENGAEVQGPAGVLSAEAGKEIGDAIVVQRWNKLKEYNGSIEISGTNANKIITYQQTKYKVIKVKGGERLITQKGSSASFVRLAVLSEFTYPTTLPYDFSTYFATDETSVRTKTNNDKIEITLPSDARYLIISSKTSTGGDLTPNILNIGGVDYLKNIEEEVVELKEKTAVLDNEVVRFTSQTLTDAQKEQVRTNIDATADFFDYVEEPQATPIAYYRPNSGSAGWYLATTANYRISNLIPIFEGDIIDVIGGYDNNSVVKNLFFNSSAKNNQDLTNAVAEAVLSNGRIEITATMILNGYAYIAFSFNTNDTPTAHATIHRKIKTDVERLDKRIDVTNDNLVRELDESSNIIDGYYNYNSSTNKYSLVDTTAYKCTPPISVNVGDVITAYPITENYYPGNPLSSAKVVMPKFDSDGNYIGYLTFDELSPTTSNVPPKYGKITITQEMYNSGVRAVGFSFKQNEGWNIYTPSVKIVRALTGDVDILKREVGRLDTLTGNQQTKIEVRKTLHNTSNLEYNEFKVFIPSVGGHRICHKFIRYYKKWDAGTYNIYKHTGLPKPNDVASFGTVTYVDDVVATDLWNNEYIGIDDVQTAQSETYIIQGNTNYIYALPDAEDYTGHGNHVGPGHGCEVAMYQKFFADGKEVDIDGMSKGESVFCDEFRFLLKGKCFASVNLNNTNLNSRLGTGPAVDEEGNPIVDCYHYMDVLFDLTGKVTVENRLMAAHDNLQFYALFDAMLNCPNGAYKYIAINSDRYKELQNGSWVDEINQDGIGTISKVDSFNQYTTIEAYNLKAKENQYADTIEMYGINFYVKHQVIQNDPSRRAKQIVHRGGYNNQMKAYYSSIEQFETDNNAETFNKGSVISVTHIREISLVADINKYYHSVVVDIPHVTYTCDDEYVTDEEFKIILTANSGYSLPESIVVSPNSINFTYDNTTGEISFPDGINTPITITKPTTT